MNWAQIYCQSKPAIFCHCQDNLGEKNLMNLKNYKFK